MAGIDDYQMYVAHQISQEQRDEWERRFDKYGGRDRMRPSDLQLQPASTQQLQAMNESIAFQDDVAVKKYVGIGVGWTSLIAEHLLSHPFVVLRRQCQVHNTSVRYHLVPLTLLPVIIRLHQRQGITTLWKGIGKRSTLTAHCALISFAVITPFYSASLVETVQSEIASERPGIFDVFKEGACRLLSWGSPQNGRMLPVWALVVPTVAFGLFRYLFGLVVQGTTSRLLQVSLRREQTRRGALPRDFLNQPVNQDIELTSCMVRDVLSDVVFYPLETVLHRLHLQGTRTIIDSLDTGYEVTPILTSYQGTRDCLETVRHDEGVAGLYKGFGALVLQYTAHFAIIKMTKFLITEVTILLRSSRSKSNPPEARGYTPVGTPQAMMPPSVQIQRQASEAARTPMGITPDQVRYFYPE
ncbi:hypothetical protein B566_EDAN010211 [Ephemera danica]|nr:hypothetical protein B566_EDAN010211 [Ephemera danica]